MTSLGAIYKAVRDSASTVYKATATEIRGIGIAVEAEVFDRAAMAWVESVGVSGIEKGDRATLLSQIREQGWFEGVIENVPTRIVRGDIL